MHFIKTVVALSVAMTGVFGLVIERQAAAIVLISTVEPEDSQVELVTCFSTTQGAAQYIAQAGEKYHCKTNLALALVANYQCPTGKDLDNMVKSLVNGKGKFTCE